jgi:hypothetical protein
MKVYQVEYYDIESGKWKTYKYCTNLKKAYEQAQQLAAMPNHQRIYRGMQAKEEERPEESQESVDFPVIAGVTDKTPANMRIDDTVKLRFTRHYVC